MSAPSAGGDGTASHRSTPLGLGCERAVAGPVARTGHAAGHRVLPSNVARAAGMKLEVELAKGMRGQRRPLVPASERDATVKESVPLCVWCNL